MNLFSKHLLLLCICGLLIGLPLGAQNNIGFEKGNLDNWKASIDGSPLNPPLRDKISGFYMAADTERAGQYINKPAVCPAGGYYSLRLGSSRTNAYANKIYTLEREIDITDDLFSLPIWFALYFEVHNGYFQIQVYDQDSIYFYKYHKLDYTYPEYNLFVNQNLSVRYTNWKLLNVPLNGLKGKKVKLRFDIRGCGEGGHTCMMWIDMPCTPVKRALRQYQCNNDLTLFLNRSGNNLVYDNADNLLRMNQGDSIRIQLPNRSGIRLISSDDITCTESIPITVSEQYRHANFSTGDKYCLYSAVSFFNLSEGFSNFKWYFGDGDSASFPISDRRKYPSAGVYKVRLIAFDSFCADSASATLEIFDNKHGLRFDESRLCVGDTACLFAYPRNPKTQVQWELNGQSLLADTLRFHVTNPGAYTLRLFSTDSNSCKDTFAGTVQAYLKPEPGFTVTEVGRNAYTFTPLVINKDLNYRWLSPLDSSNTQVFNTTVEDTGAYPIKLRITNQPGCSAEETLIINNNKSYIFVPDAFYPDHSVFLPYTHRVFRYSLMIYNRWGELLFETTDPAKGWDGKCKGELVQQDVYMYRIQMTDIHHQLFNYFGTLTVLR